MSADYSNIFATVHARVIAANEALIASGELLGAVEAEIGALA